jgi:hypothetical protein
VQKWCQVNRLAIPTMTASRGCVQSGVVTAITKAIVGSSPILGWSVFRAAHAVRRCYTMCQNMEALLCTVLSGHALENVGDLQRIVILLPTLCFTVVSFVEAIECNPPPRAPVCVESLGVPQTHFKTVMSDGIRL